MILPICIAASAACGEPDTKEIIGKLTLPKPDPTDLSGPARGIRAVTPGQAAPAPSIDLAIPFSSGSASLAPKGAAIVSALGHALASPDLAGDRFKIEGHADTVGAPESNLALSQKRAESVAATLTQHYGISADRLSAVGVGSGQLIVPTADQVPEARNRVVRIINLGAGKGD